MPPSNSQLAIPGTIGFIGGGNMARSLIGGLVAKGQRPASVLVAEPDAAARARLAADFGVAVHAGNDAVAMAADLLVLAVKPQVMRPVCEEMTGTRRKDALVLSIAAGITAAQIDRWLGGNSAVVRCMPNTPALIGAGASALFANAACTAAQRQGAESLMAAAGVCVWIEDESLMDAVTAVSGSGPAYFFHLIEALEAAARRQGLPPHAARLLVLHTALGAARMAAEGEEDAATLRQRVTSPGGTTERALQVLADGGFAALVDAAVAGATERGRELAARAGAEA
ncbi:MAG TPA: pyrroline-5-carboxylate reductase [Xanthomonadaceae bacterium]|nr:pyrroline-5-carboxylate reductase [Xanthomonadaceae bacterium]